MGRNTTGAGIWVAAAAAILIGVGSLGPWAEALGQKMAGTEGDGVITLVLALLALAALWAVAGTRKAWPALVALLIGIGVAVIGVIDYIDINDTSQLAEDLSAEEDLLGALEIQANADNIRNPAWGIYLVIVGGVALAAGSAVAWLEKNRRNDEAALDTAAREEVAAE